MFILNWPINRVALKAATVGDTDGLRRWARSRGCAKEVEKFCKDLAPFPQASAIASLLVAFEGDADALKAEVVKVCRILLRAEKSPSKGAGRPLQWAKPDMFNAWLAVEAQLRALKVANQKATIREAIRVLFSGLPKSQKEKLCVLQDFSGGGRSLYVTQETAKKYHRAFGKYLTTLPSLSQERLNRTVERLKGHYLRERK
jgi:hypothetical protein